MARRENRDGPMDARRELLKSLAQATHLIQLYRAEHPVPAAAVKDALLRLAEVVADDKCRDVVIGKADGRWMINETALPDAAAGLDLIAAAFGVHAIDSVTVGGDSQPYELAALCELLATPAQRLSDADAHQFLVKRGVRSIVLNVEKYARQTQADVKPAPPHSVVSPIPKPTTPERSLSQRLGGMPFGTFVKTLVDESVSDPLERADIYAEALKSVKASIERRVDEATRDLTAQKQRATSERARAERVMSTVADGKVVVDKDGRVLMMDPAAEEIAGKRLVELAGKRLVELAGKPILGDAADAARCVTLATDLSAPSGAPVSDELCVTGAEDVLKAYRKSIAVVEDEQGRVVGTYVVRPPEPARRTEEFLAQVTHELKAPLSSICSGLEIVSRTGRHKLTALEGRFLDISLKNAEQLRQTVSELLDFSKLESGRMQVKLVPTRVEHLVREAVEGMRPWAALKGLTLSETPLDELSQATVLADPVRIVQMLTNLISNAIKSTPESGAIAASAALGEGENSGSVVFSVRDTGCGVAPADRERIFESFTQVVGEGQRREGVGLGLTIVKEMVERHHGRLWLDSEAGRGSTFHFSIPRSS